MKDSHEFVHCWLTSVRGRNAYEDGVASSQKVHKQQLWDKKCRKNYKCMSETIVTLFLLHLLIYTTVKMITPVKMLMY